MHEDVSSTIAYQWRRKLEKVGGAQVLVSDA